ncbi:Uncharacterised protein [uncultured archaeon]|nr:Uncharacterised protein [uncultured archaeon]
MANVFKETWKDLRSETLANKAYRIWNKREPDYETAIKVRKLADKSIECQDNPRARYLRAVAMAKGARYPGTGTIVAEEMNKIDDLVYAVKNYAPDSEEIAEYHRALVDAYYRLNSNRIILEAEVPQTLLDKISFLPPISSGKFVDIADDLRLTRWNRSRDDPRLGQLADLYCERGEMYIAQGKAKEALNDFAVALEFANDGKKSYIARVCQLGGFPEMAICIYSELGGCMHSLGRFDLLELARTYAQTGKYDAALREYRLLLEKEGGNLPGLKKECEDAIGGLMARMEEERLEKILANGPKKNGALYL